MFALVRLWVETSGVAGPPLSFYRPQQSIKQLANQVAATAKSTAATWISIVEPSPLQKYAAPAP